MDRRLVALEPEDRRWTSESRARSTTSSPYGEVPPWTATSSSDSFRSVYSDYRLTTPSDEDTIQFPPPGQVSPGGGVSRWLGAGRHAGGVAALPPLGVRVDSRPASPHETMRLS
jgi:hypothetical protein